ncbi:TIGR00296 family protein [Candidatus Bathyarchaeota archaeon]|nr:TIGR00296 family protein [Candidatus Bathyarchaeota archaeon]
MGEDSHAYSDELGEYLVKMARKSLESYLETCQELEIPPDCPEELKVPSGVFVTLRKYGVPHGSSLRGCIGMIQPRSPIIEETIRMSCAAGLEDPRFPKVSLEELNDICFEVTAMTPPKKLEVEDRSTMPEHVKVGRDGLIMERGFRRGLLLPQVPVEQDPPWNAKEFLDWTCWKAGMQKGCWKRDDTTVYTFQGEIFEEEKPRGNIHRKKI